jgi:uncharacterized damage-inducible protein DinB
MRRLIRVSSVFVCVTLLCTVAAAPALAQAPSSPQAPKEPPPPLSLSDGLKQAWATIKRNVRESADKVSDADYAFKPTPDVRSFGGMIAHIADTQFLYCARIKGEANPRTQGEIDKLTTKADLLKALDDSNTYCDAAYNALTDASLTQMVKAGPREVARGVTVAGNISHSNEHYGNLVTYMRLKGIVPPSTERSQMPAPKKPSEE